MVPRVRLALHEALHGLRSGRGATALAFAILTLAMAGGTVTFSIVDAVALRPLNTRCNMPVIWGVNWPTNSWGCT